MIRLAIRRPIAVAMTYLGLGLLGIVAWQRIPIELLPEADLPRLSVVAYWPGASPETTEAFLTSPIEAVVQQVHGVAKVESVSSQEQGMGTASIQVQFNRDTDMDFARLELSELLAALESELPPGAYRPRVLAYVPEELQEQSTPFLSYTVTGPYTLEALRHHLDEVIAPEIRQVEGVAQVVADGGRDRLLEIELDESRIQALGLAPREVRQRVMEMEIVQEAGRVNRDGTLYTLSIRERTDSPEEIRNLPLLTNQGRVVRVEDVGVVRDTYEEARDNYRIDGMPAVSFTVYKELRTNTVEVADRVKARLGSIAALHPAGVHLILDDDESEAIRAQLSDLRFRALVAAVVIFLVLLLFLRSVRSAAVVFVTIAFSILITLQLVYFGGFSLNVLTLMGLAMGFGLVVDNAIVVLENIYRLRREGLPAPEAAERGAREVVLPVLAATLTTLVVMVPFVYLQGELRVFYVPLALVVGFSLLASLFVAFTLIPALAGRRGGYRLSVSSERLRRSGYRSDEPKDSGGTAALSHSQPPLYQRFYASLTGLTLRFPWVTIVLALLMLGGSYYLFDKYVSRGVVWGRWGMDDTYIDVRFTMPRGEELERTDQLVRYFEERIERMPEVERFVTNVQPQYASIRITFPDSLEMTAVPVAIKEQMVAFSHGFGGVEVRVIGYGPSFYGGGSSPPNYSIQVLGYNYEQVRRIAEDLGQRLTRFARIQDVDTNSYGSWYVEDRATEMVLRIDRAALAMHRLTTLDIVRHVRAAVAGREGRGSVVRMDGEELSFSVKLEGSRELDALALPELLIPAPNGESVRLGSVATLDERQVLSRILREDQQYQRRISYEFHGPTKLGDVIRDVVVDATELPGYTLVTENEWSWSVEEREQIYGVLAVALLLVFMVTASVFESLRQPLIVLLTVPMALIGVFLTFFYTGASFTREAYIGVIMMGGIVVNNAILLVDHINGRRAESEDELRPTILRATLERVRPILMTSATTIFGLLPLVLFSDYADANIWNALGYALIGGLASSTILVLTVTPALYLLFERRKERRRVASEQPARIPAGMREVPT